MKVKFLRLAMFLLLLAILTALAACVAVTTAPTTNSEAAAAVLSKEDPLQVVTTIGMLTDIAQIVGGEHVAVTGLMGAGTDPHQYVATENDVATLNMAELIIYNGNFLEAQMDDILHQLGERKPTLAVAQTIDPSLLLEWEEYPDQYDPHIWFDVTLWMKATAAIRDQLIELDPTHAESYRANTEAYLAELQTLHDYVLEQAARVPQAQRVLITAHDAFNYFGHQYGFEVRGLQGISTASEAGVADVQALADFIVERQIKAIFVESSVPVRNVEALQAAVQAKGATVGIGGELFSDAMGDPGTLEGTYVGMIRHNIDTIVGALLGETE